MLADEYVPEVAVANELRGAANRIMYEMRGYGFTEDAAFYEGAQKELKAVEAALETARKLEANSPNLKMLKAQIETATKAVDDYKLLVQQTVDANAKLKAQRKIMSESAGKFMAVSNDFLGDQALAMDKILVESQDMSSARGGMQERLDKINLANDITDLCNNVRFDNWKAQATRNPGGINEALQIFPRIEVKLNELQKITKS